MHNKLTKVAFNCPSKFKTTVILEYILPTDHPAEGDDKCLSRQKPTQYACPEGRQKVRNVFIFVRLQTLLSNFH